MVETSEKSLYTSAAASDVIWKNKKACGHYYKVRCIGATNYSGISEPCKDKNYNAKVVERSICLKMLSSYLPILRLGGSRLRIDYEKRIRVHSLKKEFRVIALQGKVLSSSSDICVVWAYRPNVSSM
ncbi:myb domain protein 27 [Prunus dulcis]|uniref:Myb domain protein 27 n=1 Tax=Prunus dulcis TaxID=3755 RepID=A0A4Y1QLP8_PRUDU|nr:myb domain protein 27 [Prunus dulcis]